MVKVLTAALCMLLGFESAAYAAAPSSREQVEQLLASQIPSGSSPATVARFLDAQGAPHGTPGKSGPSVVLQGTFRNLSSAAQRVNLHVRFSFLQDRLIGYSFTESPVAR